MNKHRLLELTFTLLMIALVTIITDDRDHHLKARLWYLIAFTCQRASYELGRIGLEAEHHYWKTVHP